MFSFQIKIINKKIFKFLKPGLMLLMHPDYFIQIILREEASTFFPMTEELMIIMKSTVVM